MKVLELQRELASMSEQINFWITITQAKKNVFYQNSVASQGHKAQSYYVTVWPPTAFIFLPAVLRTLSL